MNNEFIKYVIFSQGKSGSSLLCNLLKKHPDVINQGEYFNTLSSSAIFKTTEISKVNRDLIRTYIGNIYGNRSNIPCKAIGFKYIFSLHYILFPEVWEYLYENRKEIRMIATSRRNHLKRFLSATNAVIQRKKDPSSIPVPSEFEFEKIHLDAGSLAERLRYMETEYRSFKSLLEHFPSIISFDYDDLLNNINKVLWDSFTFLGVDPNVEVQSHYKKITPDNLQDAIENYDEVFEVLTGTPYEWCIADPVLSA
ncbi:hypothetical protein KJ652_06530 [Patescibacteria group bacterium]|nr:hypothetical protein [Patescibacteria group bacterium]MBU1124207.1 hypothetical protein [Patescibacteria group bacterium]MBU1911581.1 hypothetical protein [Patescibacteria group bacterium]